MHGYFRDYVEKFGLRETITFKTMVEKARRNADGTWDVTLDTGETRTYDALVVANGHHWDPRMPEYPGTFDGAIIHSHDYLNGFDPIDMRGRTSWSSVWATRRSTSRRSCRTGRSPSTLGIRPARVGC